MRTGIHRWYTAAATGALLTLSVASPQTSTVAAASPGENIAAQWDSIAVNTVVSSGTFQNEGTVYMAYVTAAMYDAAVAIDGRYVPYAAPLAAPAGASSDAAVVEAARVTLDYYLPAKATTVDALAATSLAAIPDGTPKTDGAGVGHAAAEGVIAARTGDGRLTPIGVTSAFPTLAPAPGVWRLTPPAFARPQTPWMATMRPLVLDRPDRFRPDGPPPLTSPDWVAAFNEIKAVGAANSTVRTPEQTATAYFWSANGIRQWNRTARDLADSRHLDLVSSARLFAMVDVVGADAAIAVMNEKYHFLFWRPVTAIDPTAVSNDGFGPVPGFDDGDPLTVEQTGWRPLLTTPNHPEYPAAHGTVTSAMAEVFTQFLGTREINLTIHGFDQAGAPGNFDAVRTFASPTDLREQIVDARLWAGLHYRFSTEAGVDLGRSVAKYDLRHAFLPVDDATARAGSD
ncbi:vanadium-dependent haloperoxidase [Sinomonas sp. P10A9]|uniref:Vanadium-dependent haloperoxidase n=1 Tax=Sinomonas puerhi TaxID=3238584 RepID=A0AB39L3Z7_9MICC